MGPVDIDTLFNYIQYNDAEELSEAFNDERVDSNCTNSEGWSLLHIACQEGKLECVEVLLNPRIKVNIKGSDRITPLL